jgi:uncharacterized protein
MNLSEKLNHEMKESMKNKEALKISVLRLIKSAITNEEKRQARALNEDELNRIVQKEQKKRKESIEAFKQGGRADLVEKEEAEMAIFSALFPELSVTVSENDTRAWVKEIIASLPPQEAPALGKIMPLILKKTAGRIDGKTVNRIVREELDAR